MKKYNRGFGSLSLAILAVLFLVVAPARAQKAAATAVAPAEETTPEEDVGVTATPSQVTTQVSGDATAERTGLAETVTFAGDVVIDATVVTDPALPTGVSLFVDCKALRGSGNDTDTVYINSCEHNVTRLFRPTDKITLTFAFFEEKGDAFLKAKTGVITLNLTYDEATRKLTGASGVVGTLDATTTTTTTGSH